MKKPLLTLAFSDHRPEVLPLMEEAMRRHQVIILEEPPHPAFKAMLEGDHPIEDYLLETDTEYPELGRRVCRLLQNLHAEGKSLLQVEPFLEHLVAIHEHLAEGGSAKDFRPRPETFQVYEAERIATAALLHYYESAFTRPFEAVVRAVQDFARADASRFRLRDRMRAEALSKMLLSLGPERGSVYVESGYIHYGLSVELRKRLPPTHELKLLHLTGPVTKGLLGKREALGPGDVLTLLYWFHPHYTGPRADLLAARSLIYIKVLEKEEIVEDLKSFPHLRNEVECIQKVGRLSLEDCEALFPKIRRASTGEARHLLDRYVSAL